MGEIIGRLHPLIVHLPIGIIILAFLMECASRLESYKYIKPAIKFVLQIAILTSAVAWFTGWIMPKEGDFDERLVGLHFWFAVSMTATTCLVYFLHITQNSNLKKFYFPMFSLTMLLLTITGHFGGSLTHGEDFLTKPIQKEKKVVVADVNQLMIYADLIQPIIKKKCYSCHNEGKKKGDLIMTTLEALIKGGEEGPAIVIGNADQSAMIQRVHLPIEDDKHMPPKGKKQLNKKEVQLLQWWINEGAHTDKKIAEIPKDESIETILKDYEQKSSLLDSTDLADISDDKIAELISDNIMTARQHEGSPFVLLSMSRDTNLTTSHISAISKIKNNVTELDLSFTNLTDKMLSSIKEYKNLQVLKLQKTNITNKGLDGLSSLKNLRVLNLYGTQVDDKGLEKIKDIPSLQALYIWQTAISPDAAKVFAEDKPLVQLNYRIDSSIFGDASLKPPGIIAEKEIFSDTLRVELQLNIQSTKIYYTIDGSEPDSSSTLYTKPFLIDKTSTIKAITTKPGWKTSVPAEKVFIQAGYVIAEARLASAPNDKYKAKGAASLIDFEKGSLIFTDNKWLGYEGKDLKATLDLGKPKSVSSVTVSALEETTNYIFFPKSIEISSSKDGKNYTSVKKLDIPIAQGPHPGELKSFLIEFNPIETRYIKTDIYGTKKNPSWHTAPGAKNWVFIDEIMVN